MRVATRSALAALVLSAAGILAAGPAQALDRRVRVVNASTQPIVEFYGTHFGNLPSQEDMLGADNLAAGKSVVLNFEDGSGYCRFSFRAVFADGVELARPSVNVCEVGTYRYTD